MEELFDWIKNHKKTVAGILIIIIFGIPFMINILFKFTAPTRLFEAEWEAPDALAYYGALLSFLSTSLLSMLALWQNEKLQKLEESRESPILLCQNVGCSGNYGDLNISLINANNNSMVYEIAPIDFKIVNELGTVISEAARGTIDKKCLGGNEQTANIKFKNESISEDNVYIIFKIKCFDLYHKEHIYEFRQFVEKSASFSGSTPYMRKEL